MTVEERDKPVQQPAQQDEVGRGEERTVEEWVEIIREKGAAFYLGKVAPSWKIAGAEKAGLGWDWYGRVNISEKAAMLVGNSFVSKANNECNQREITSKWSHYLIAGSVAELIGEDFFGKLQKRLSEEGIKEKLGEEPGVIFYVF